MPTYAGTVHLTSSDPLAVLSGDITFRAQDEGSRSGQVMLFSGGQQSVTGTDTGNANITGTQAHINVRVGRTHLRITAPTSVTAAQNFNITVAAVDAYGNVDPNYTSTVALTAPMRRRSLAPPAAAGQGALRPLLSQMSTLGKKRCPASC